MLHTTATASYRLLSHGLWFALRWTGSENCVAAQPVCEVIVGQAQISGLMIYSHWGTMGIAILVAAVFLYKLCKAHKRVTTAPTSAGSKASV